jgi:hypothetical protein
MRLTVGAAVTSVDSAAVAIRSKLAMCMVCGGYLSIWRRVRRGEGGLGWPPCRIPQEKGSIYRSKKDCCHLPISVPWTFVVSG